MGKLKIKSGDTVRVIAGDHKGSEGKVLTVFRDKNKVIVEGVNMVKKHMKFYTSLLNQSKTHGNL